MTQEYKTYVCDIKTSDENQGRISGYLAVFGNVDSQKDIIHQGAFTKTIQEAYSRREHQGKRFLVPLLWMHDPMQPIGGYTTLREDKNGLYFEAEIDIATNEQGTPLNPFAMAKYSGCKMGYLNEQSIGYEAIQKDYDAKTGIRHLLEVRLWEGSLVVQNFASNELAQVTGVKDALQETEEHKATVTGNTSGPIGPRDEAWDGAAAKNQIWAAAENDDGSLKVALCRKYFMVLDGDPQLKGSWGYPFWYVGANPHICVGAVKAIAAAAQGARGASAPDGIKAKVETLYGRINTKYPDDPELVPPWKSSTTPQPKSFAERRAQEMCEDLLEDWAETLLEPLTAAILDSFQDGGEGVDAVLADFTDAVKEWYAQATAYNLGDFLAQATQNSFGGNGISTEEDTMRPRFLLSRTKAGARFSSSTVQALQNHVDGLHEIASTIKKKASDLTNLWREEGLGEPYANDKTGTQQQEDKTTLARRRPDTVPPAREAQQKDGDISSTDLELALSRLGTLTNKVS